MDISKDTKMMSHNINRRRWLMLAASSVGVVILSSTLSACGASTSRGESGGTITHLELGSNDDELTFDHTMLTAPAGATVELTFHNRSTHHQHNWVLVNGGDAEADAVYEDAIAAGVKQDWLPAESENIVAHTPLVNSRKRATITFQAPSQTGDYSYLCTFPGHFLAGMKGILTVT